MSDAQSTIERFQKMATDDPSNELGHFSLGKAYLDAGRAADAVPSFNRVIEINPKFSKAFAHLGQALIAAGRREEAIARLTAGVKVAHERGDLMPRNEMTQMLRDLGAPVPELAEAAKPPIAVGDGQVLCRRCGQVAPRLPKPPFKREFGKQIQANVCAECWEAAFRLGTKVINELRLDFTDPGAQRIWDQHIREFLNLPAAG